MDTFTLLTSLNAGFPISNLVLLPDNEFLIAISKKAGTLRRAAFWPIELNENAFRINVSLKGVSNCYVTPDNNYLVTMIGQEELSIWNIKSRTEIEKHECNLQDLGFPIRPLNGSNDSKYIFFEIESPDVVQWDCES